jgi:hypothetical protein
MRRTAQVLRAHPAALPKTVDVIHSGARKKLWSKSCSELLVLDLRDTLGLLIATKAP